MREKPIILSSNRTALSIVLQVLQSIYKSINCPIITPKRGWKIADIPEPEHTVLHNYEQLHLQAAKTERDHHLFIKIGQHEQEMLKCTSILTTKT